MKMNSKKFWETSLGEHFELQWLGGQACWESNMGEYFELRWLGGQAYLEYQTDYTGWNQKVFKLDNKGMEHLLEAARDLQIEFEAKLQSCFADISPEDAAGIASTLAVHLDPMTHPFKYVGSKRYLEYGNPESGFFTLLLTDEEFDHLEEWLGDAVDRIYVHSLGVIARHAHSSEFAEKEE